MCCGNIRIRAAENIENGASPMTTIAPLISAHELISWLNRMALNNPRINIEHVKAHVRYMRAHGDGGYRAQFGKGV